MIFCGHILQTVYIQGNIYRKYTLRQDMHNVEAFLVVSQVLYRDVVIVSPLFLFLPSPFSFHIYILAFVSLSLLLLLFVRVQVFSGQKKILFCVMNRMCKQVETPKNRVSIKGTQKNKKAIGSSQKKSFYTRCFFFSHTFELV